MPGGSCFAARGFPRASLGLCSARELESIRNGEELSGALAALRMGTPGWPPTPLRLPGGREVGRRTVRWPRAPGKCLGAALAIGPGAARSEPCPHQRPLAPHVGREAQCRDRGRQAPTSPGLPPPGPGQCFEDTGEQALDDNVHTVPSRRAVDSSGIPAEMQVTALATRCGLRPMAPRLHLPHAQPPLARCQGPQSGRHELQPNAQGARRAGQAWRNQTGPTCPLQGPHPAVGVAEPTHHPVVPDEPEIQTFMKKLLIFFFFNSV